MEILESVVMTFAIILGAVAIILIMALVCDFIEWCWDNSVEFIQHHKNRENYKPFRARYARIGDIVVVVFAYGYESVPAVVLERWDCEENCIPVMYSDRRTRTYVSADLTFRRITFEEYKRLGHKKESVN